MATKALITTPGIDVQFLIDEADSGGTTTAFLAESPPASGRRRPTTTPIGTRPSTAPREP